MSWTDLFAPKQILQMRDDFNINMFVETGTFRGVNTRFHADNFKHIASCEISKEYYDIARENTKDLSNVYLFRIDSVEFLSQFILLYEAIRRDDIVFIYLDAHFYDPNLPSEEQWVVVNELKALKGFTKCVICIHDFDCQGLGHLVYDGEHLNFDLVGPYLKEINPDFFYYTNTREWGGSVTEEMLSSIPGLIVDDSTVDNIRYANSSDIKKYRGILYCTPKELDLSKYNLVRGYA